MLQKGVPHSLQQSQRAGKIKTQGFSFCFFLSLLFYLVARSAETTAKASYSYSYSYKCATFPVASVWDTKICWPHWWAESGLCVGCGLVGKGMGKGKGKGIALLWLNFTHDRTARVGCVCASVCARLGRKLELDSGLGIEIRIRAAVRFAFVFFAQSVCRSAQEIQHPLPHPAQQPPPHLIPLHVCLSPWQASTRRVAGDVSIIGVAYAHNGSTNTRALVVWWWWWWWRGRGVRQGWCGREGGWRGAARWLGRDIKFSLSWAQIKARSINKQRAAHFMPQRRGRRKPGGGVC